LSRTGISGVLRGVRDESERALVLGLKRGDRSAFDATYEKYRAPIFGFLLRLAGRRHVAEDLLQEVWLKLARHASRLDDETDLAAWLFTVARNAHVSHRRWSMLDLSRLVALADEARIDGDLDDAASPERSMEASRTLQRLERALMSLATSDREILLLVGVEELEQEQAAAILGIRYDAFRQRLSRARNRLAVALDALPEAPPQKNIRDEVST
jgi:RNA polymerase sigma-70 factor (ECF subfamily)